MVRTQASLALLLALAACSTPEKMTRAGLRNAGLGPNLSACMADRMVHRLNLLQLRRLGRLGSAGEAKNLDQYLHRVRALGDPEIWGVVSSSAALCATGLTSGR